LQTQLLIWRIAKENPLWGYGRIQGELLKVGIEISASSHRSKAKAGPEARYMEPVHEEPSSVDRGL
jgi:hypothetical protein